MPTSIPLTPRRRWALAIGLPFVIASIGYSALNYVSLIGEDSYAVAATPVPGSGEVTLGVGSGDIYVSPSDNGRSVYSAKVYYSLVRPKLHWKPSANGAFLVGGPNCFWVGSCGVNLRLSLLSGRAVDASSGSGNVSVRNLTGAVQVNDGSGNIVAKDLSGALKLSDSSGNISGTGLASGSVRAADGSGNVDLDFNKPPAEVKVHDGSGNITVRVPSNVSYYVVGDASSGSSNIYVPQDRLSRFIIDLSDGSGNINVLPLR